MKKRDLDKYIPGTAEYVVMHSRYQKSRGRGPSMSFWDQRNPRRALRLARAIAYFPEEMALPSAKDMMEKAEKIARVIYDKLYDLQQTPLKDVGLGSMLSLFMLSSELKAGKDVDWSIIAPEISEVYLFGSVARGEKYPHDIDLIVIDNGHFSQFVAEPTPAQDDWYACLPDNFSWLMSAWFGIEGKKHYELFGDVHVDLHLLPEEFFTDDEYRFEVKDRHHDERFFEKAFGDLQRFDRELDKFVPVPMTHLEERFDCSLADLH